jgi:hypothetical protein
MDDGQASSLQRLLSEGWERHGEEAEDLARQLEAAAAEEIAPEQLATVIHLCVHTIGEHLCDWPRALRLGQHILDGRTPTPQTARAWGRLSVAATLSGDPVEALALELSYLKVAGDDFGAALLDMRLMLTDALVSAKRTGEAARLYRDALDLAGQIRQSPLLDRTIAVASNNIGWELYESPARAPGDDALMKLAADTSYKFWLTCGNWINEQRALCLKAVVAHATGDAAAALAYADAGLAIIAANGERPLDAARLHCARAAALEAMGDGDAATRAIADADAIASTLRAAN